MPYGDRRLYGVCCAEKGTFRFTRRARAAAPATPPCPALADNALLKLAARDRAARRGRASPYDVTDEPRALLRGARRGPRRPRAARVARMRGDRAAARRRWSSRRCGVTFAPTIISASEKINVIPARAELRVDCRVPPGHGRRGRAGAASARCSAAHDGVEVEFIEQVVGNRSPIESPLMDAIRGLGRRAGPRRRGRARRCCPRSPTRAGCAPRSRTASPTASSPSATRRCTRPGR